MSKSTKKQGGSSVKELLQALLPLQETEIAHDAIDKLNQPQTKMPTGKNANAEKLLYGLIISSRLFHHNKAALLKQGNSLKRYIHRYAKKVPLSKAPFLIHHFKKFIGPNNQPSSIHTPKKNKR